MNREIKFRCWDKEDNKMLSHEDLKDINWSYSGLTKKNNNYVLMQYTGLKDTKNIEIYEGDIVKYKTFYFGEEQEHIYEIKWLENEPTDLFNKPNFYGYLKRWEKCKIIGNIYENKELLGD